MRNLLQSKDSPKAHYRSEMGSSNGFLAHTSRSTNTLAVNEIYARLGEDAVLIPAPTRNKGPRRKGWPSTTFADTQSTQWQAELKTGNVCVLLGEPGGGICSIDFDSDYAAETFDRANPSLDKTLRTRGSRGCNVWLRLDGEIPESGDIKDSDGKPLGEWRADGRCTMITGTHPSGELYRTINEYPVITINYDCINWPEDWQAPRLKTVEDQLAEKYGQLFLDGGKSLNPQFVVGRFLAEHRLLFEPDERTFYGYEDHTGLWVEISQDQLKVMLADDLIRLAEETNQQWILGKTNDYNLSSFVRALQGRAERKGAFSGGNDIVHVKNGILIPQADEWKLTGFSPDYYSRNQIPYDFDENARCDRFLNELLRPALDEDDIKLLQVLFGSVLLGGNEAQVLFLLIGTAGGGKSTLMNILEGVIGRDNVTELRTHFLSERFETSRYVGMRLLAAKDVSANFLQHRAVGVIKALVGGDTLSVEAKGSNKAVDIKGNFAVSITANSRLKVRLEGDAGAWERRLVIVDFSQPKPEKPIPTFAVDLLREEGSGILNWMLVGASEFRKQMSSIGCLELTEKQKLRVTNLLSESDSLRFFVQRRVVRTSGRDVTSSELQQAYSEFCDEMDWSAIPTSRAEREIKDLMMEVHRRTPRGDIKRDGKNQRGYSDIEILRPEDGYEQHD